MRKVTLHGLSLWQFDLFEKEPSIRHFVSDRNSAGADADFTLGFSSTPDKERVRKNRSMIAAAMGVSEDRLIFPSQVHRTRIVHVHALTSRDELMETDALITNEPGICVSVMSADCVPILLLDREHQVVAAVHSGWRGTVARILEKTLVTMREQYGTKGEDLIAGIGPSVSQESYEVGEEVVDSVKDAFGSESGLLIPHAANKARLDLWKANRVQLEAFGVRDRDIEVSGLCTVVHNNHFFSARKGDRGRFAAGIMLM